MDTFGIASESEQPVAGEIRDQLLESFLTAVRVALGEMAGMEVLVRAVSWKVQPHALGDIAAVLRLQSATEGFLVLGFPQQTAAALAGRILTGATADIEENLIRDCVGEIANVVAGQAKAMLADTPYRFTFSLPEVVIGAKEIRTHQCLECLVAVFNSDLGEFALQLYLKRRD